MATRKGSAKKDRPTVRDLSQLAELHDPDQVQRLAARLAEQHWRDQNLRPDDYRFLDRLLQEHSDGEVAADTFVATMAEQGVDPLSLERLFIRTPLSIVEVCRGLHLITPDLDLLHEELVAHDINPAFKTHGMLWEFARIYCEDTDRSADTQTRLREAVAKLDAWRRNDQKRTLVACPKCGSTRLSRIETVKHVHPLQAVWLTANGNHDWEDLDEDDRSETEEEEDGLDRGEGWISESSFSGMLCEQCNKELKSSQLDKLVPAAKQPDDSAGELIEALPADPGWARVDKLAGVPTIEALLDEAERQVRAWWSAEISNRGAGPSGVLSEHWVYRVAGGKVSGRPMPLTIGAFPTLGAYRNAAELMAGGEAGILVFPGQHVDRPAERGMVLIAIRLQEARTRWIPFQLDREVDREDMAEEVAELNERDPSEILMGDYFLLSKGHEDVEPVDSTRPYVEMVQQKLQPSSN